MLHCHQMGVVHRDLKVSHLCTCVCVSVCVCVFVCALNSGKYTAMYYYCFCACVSVPVCFLGACVFVRVCVCARAGVRIQTFAFPAFVPITSVSGTLVTRSCVFGAKADEVLTPHSVPFLPGRFENKPCYTYERWTSVDGKARLRSDRFLLRVSMKLPEREKNPLEWTQMLM